MDQLSAKTRSFVLPILALATSLFGMQPVWAQDLSEPFDNAASVASQALFGSIFRSWRMQRDLSELDYFSNGYPLIGNNLYCAVPEPDRPVVIRTQADYDLAIKSLRKEPDCQYFNRGPEIDFSKSVLIGYRTEVPGCVLFGTKRSASKSDDKRRVEIKIKAEYTQKCQAGRSDSISWLRIPLFPEGYAVTVIHRAQLYKDWPDH